MSIAVILPTRGRPWGAKEAVESVIATRRLPGTSVVVVLDQDDPEKHNYTNAWLEIAGLRDGDRIYEFSGNMIQRTNLAASAILGSVDYDILGWMADDNRMRTEGWDERVTEALSAPGIGFANLNDLFWSEYFPRDKPVNTYVRASIVRALGWYANPGQMHHYMDDTWRMLGTSTDSLVYLRDVICEHMHPSVGKAEWDAGYRYTESGEVNQREQAAFMNWIWDRFREDRQTVQACLSS